MFEFKPWARYGGGRSTWYKHVKDGLLPPGVPVPGGRTAWLTAELGAVDAAIAGGAVVEERRQLVRELVTRRSGRIAAAELPAAPAIPPAPNSPLLTRREAAAVLRVSEATFGDLAKRADFPRPVSLGPRCSRYVREEVMRWVLTQRSVAVGLEVA